MINISIPEGVLEIIKRLQKAGFCAHAVGGCVRDSLLGKSPLDWDITTPALPAQIIALFADLRQIQIGSRHGTVAVKSHGQYYEITTYRIDGEYHDGRRPASVSFTSDLYEDLRRRDFTINAMAYSPKTGLSDHFGGLDDLRAGIVRCVGDPTERFAEDHLRIMRAYRFAAVLGFSLDAATREAALSRRHRLENVARERIGAELSKLLTASNFEAIKVFLDDCVDVVFPDFAALRGVAQSNPYHRYDVYEHSIEVLRHTPNTLHQRLAAVFHDTGKAHTKSTDPRGIDHFYAHARHSERIAAHALQHYCFDNNTKSKVLAIVAHHDKIIQPEKPHVKRFLNKHGVEQLHELLVFQRADNLAKSEAAADRLHNIESVLQIFREILDSKEPLAARDLVLSGKDIMAITGLPEGPQIGEILAKLLSAVLKNPELNTREQLKKLI